MQLVLASQGFVCFASVAVLRRAFYRAATHRTQKLTQRQTFCTRRHKTTQGHIQAHGRVRLRERQRHEQGQGHGHARGRIRVLTRTRMRENTRNKAIMLHVAPNSHVCQVEP